jgi:hypothetical protein
LGVGEFAGEQDGKATEFIHITIICDSGAGHNGPAIPHLVESFVANMVPGEGELRQS